MTDSIRNFGISASAQHSKSLLTKVSEETKKKLEALGIDPSTVHSETEAQQKIKEAQESTQVVDTTLPQKGNSQIDYMQQAFLDAKDLAERLGIKAEDKQNTAELLKKIEFEISNIEIQNKDNPEQQQLIQDLKEEFMGISSDYSKAQQGQAKISGDMGLLASYNKLNSSVEIGSVTKEQILTLQQPQQSENSQNSKQDSENRERNSERINDNIKNINVKNADKNEKQKKSEKPEEEKSFLTQIKEKLTGGVFTKEDALNPIKGETVTDRQIFNKAKRLAEQLGIPAGNTVGLNELLFTLNNRIQKMEAEKQDNTVAFRKEFNTIYNSYMEIHK